MSLDHREGEETHTTKNLTEQTSVIQENNSVGSKVEQGVSGAMKVIHGVGETIRGLAIDVADLGKGSGKTIAAEGKAETKEGVRQIEESRV